MSQIRKTYKDTLFRIIFSTPENMLSLYNALNHSNYTDPSSLEITTLEDAVYLGMKNDCSFVFNQDLNIFEHQSTVNPNMPLRDLFYLSSILTQRIPQKELYRRAKVRIPNPKFVVFYQGNAPMPVRSTYRLSELFVKETDSPEIELSVTVVNIDPKMGDQVLSACRLLGEFAEFVSVAQSKLNSIKGQGQDTRERALNETIEECISRGILADILQKERDKVISSMLSEYNEQEVREVIADDAYQRGHEQGEIKGNKQGERRLAQLISLLLRDGKTDEVAKVAEDETLREQYYQRYGIDKNAE